MSGSRIVILGGSSPFTAGLINAFKQQALEGIAATLVLHGRNQKHLELVTHFAQAQLRGLDWEISSSTSMEKAVEGANIVLHQIRYDGLAGRADGERFCAALNIPADETLGPAALLTGIRSLPGLQRTSSILATICPEACVLNLTNPLSAVTSVMQQYGVKNCFGLCELPQVTMESAISQFGLTPERVAWTYTGLNHRGFIDTLQCGADDLIAQLPEQLGDRGDIGGIVGAEIAELKAIPLKYFRLMRTKPCIQAGRAAALMSLRDRLTTELERSCTSSPPSLTERYMDWYPRSVVPVIIALLREKTERHVVNALSPSGLVRECHALIHGSRIQPQFHDSMNHSIRTWCDRFENHERAFVAAMMCPGKPQIKSTLEQDPLVPSADVQSTLSQMMDYALQ